MDHTSLGTVLPLVASIYAAVALTGCPTPMAPPPPEEPMIAAPEAPRIPWLAAGTPDIAPPQIPWLTDESACPDGWGWVEVAPGVNGCDPYPIGRIEDCGPTGAHFPGEAGCRDLDSGDTEWPRDLPATNVIYVREGASGGDGTIDLPYATLPEALAVATEGTTIALAPGRYDTGQGEELAASPGVFDTLSNITVDGLHLRGTSVARTTLFSSRPAPPAGGGDVGMLVVRARDVVVSDLRFESPHTPLAGIGGSVVVSRVVLDGTFQGLLAVEGCTAVFEDVIARNTTGLALVAAFTAANVTLRRAVLEGTGVHAAVALGTSSVLVLEDVWADGFQASVGAGDGGSLQFHRLGVRGPTAVALTASGGQLTGGWLVLDLESGSGGAFATAGGVLVVEDVVGRSVVSEYGHVQSIIDGQATVSRAVLDGRTCVIAESTLDASDIVCVNPDSPGFEGRAGAILRVSRADVSVGTAGLWAYMGARLDASDVWIHDLGGADSGARASGATLSLERVRIERASNGILADYDGHVTASDVAMHDLVVRSADFGAASIVAVGASTVTASRVLVDGVDGTGGFAADMGALELEDLVVRGVRGPLGRSAGLAVASDGRGTFRRVEIDGSAEQGAVLLGPAEIEDLTVQNISASVDGQQGFGVVVGTAVEGMPPSVSAHRVAVRDVDARGIVVAGAELGAIPGRLSLALTDVRVERVRMAALGGGGVTAQGEADVSIDGFVMRDTAHVGIASSMGARLLLSRGLIASTDVCTSSDSPLDLTTVQTDQCGPSARTVAP